MLYGSGCASVSTADETIKNAQFIPIKKGARAPISGTIVDDETFRELDLGLARLSVCEKSLYKMESCVTEPSLIPPFTYFLLGAVVSGVFISITGR